MAKQRGPVASTFSGRVGNVVGAKLKGGEYVTRSYQPSVKNPNTVRQQASRARLSFASALGARLSQAIGIGFAAAAGSTKMYPRNLFLKKIYGSIAQTGNNCTLANNKYVMSEKVGCDLIPAGDITNNLNQHKLTFNVTNGEDVVMPNGNGCGLVMVVVGDNPDDRVIVVTSTNTQGEEIDVTGMKSESFACYCFFKELIPSKNAIATNDYPWRYPSATGATAFFGVVEEE